MAAATQSREIVIKKSRPAQRSGGGGGLVLAGASGGGIGALIGALLIRFGISPLWASVIVTGFGGLAAWFGRGSFRAGGIGALAMGGGNLLLAGVRKITEPARPALPPGPAGPAAPGAPRQAAINDQEAARILENIRADYYARMYQGFQAQQQPQGYGYPPRY